MKRFVAFPSLHTVAASFSVSYSSWPLEPMVRHVQRAPIIVHVRSFEEKNKSIPYFGADPEQSVYEHVLLQLPIHTVEQTRLL